MSHHSDVNSRELMVLFQSGCRYSHADKPQHLTHGHNLKFSEPSLVTVTVCLSRLRTRCSTKVFLLTYTIFLYIRQCSSYRLFGEACCLHRQEVLKQFVVGSSEKSELTQISLVQLSALCINVKIIKICTYKQQNKYC